MIIIDAKDIVVVVITCTVIAVAGVMWIIECIRGK